MSLRLFLPRYAPPALATAVSRRNTGGRPTILVVEDDAAVRGACVEILRELDYEVLQAPDAMEAFRLIADHGGIDLLFTDLGLPGGVSGRALADAARNVDAGIRVLFTTGYQRVDLTDRAGTALLRKPFNPAQLAAMVHDVLAAQPPVAQPPVSRPPVAQPPVAQPSVPRSEKVHG
jgi:CheY-like chemotaxis protein